MVYTNVVEGRFISRPNRFIAMVEIDGAVCVCHVKNTGRCKELLLPGRTVYLQKADSPVRKTGYDLIAVRKGEDIVNIDAMAPNRVFAEWVRGGNFFKNLHLIRPETTHGDSRFDFYLEGDGRRVFVEVKGVTLEENGHLFFPDAPTQRGVKHLKGLENCVSEGYEAVCFFVIQMRNAIDFAPNARTHPEFAQALKHAAQNGVQIMAMNCTAAPDRLELDRAIKVLL